MSLELPPSWRDYRNRRRSLLAILAGVPLLWGAGAWLAGVDGAGEAMPALLSAWTTSFVAAAVWFAAFRCPSCSRPFHWTWLVANPLARACLHCGFAKWRDPHAARAYVRR